MGGWDVGLVVACSTNLCVHLERKAEEALRGSEEESGDDSERARGLTMFHMGDESENTATRGRGQCGQLQPWFTPLLALPLCTLPGPVKRCGIHIPVAW